MKRAIFLLPMIVLLAGCAPVAGAKGAAWLIAIIAAAGSVWTFYSERQEEKIANKTHDLNNGAHEYAVQCRNGHSHDSVVALPTTNPEDESDSLARAASQRG